MSPDCELKGGHQLRTIPLPHFGGSVSYRISLRWSANATALAFALEIDNYGGSLVEVDTPQRIK